MLQIFESVAVWRKHWASAMEAIKAAAGGDEQQAKKKQKVEKMAAELEEKTAVRCPFPLSAHCLLLSPPSVHAQMFMNMHVDALHLSARDGKEGEERNTCAPPFDCSLPHASDLSLLCALAGSSPTRSSRRRSRSRTATSPSGWANGASSLPSRRRPFSFISGSHVCAARHRKIVVANGMEEGMTQVRCLLFVQPMRTGVR